GVDGDAVADPAVESEASTAGVAESGSASAVGSAAATRGAGAEGSGIGAAVESEASAADGSGAGVAGVVKLGACVPAVDSGAADVGSGDGVGDPGRGV